MSSILDLVTSVKKGTNVKLLFLSLFLVAAHRALAMEPVTLPPKKEIKESFCNQGWKHFTKKTAIHKKLQKDKTPDEIATVLETNVQTYNKKYANNYCTRSLTKKDTENMIHALFKDHPDIAATLTTK